MKQHFLLSALFVCISIASAQAQIKKGSIWLGGNIGYSENKNDFESNPDYKYRSLGINPAIGTAIKDNLIAGIIVSYNKTRVTNNGSIIESKDILKGGGIFVRQYVPIVNRLYVFGEANATYKSFRGNESQSYNNIKINKKGWEAALNFSPGVSYGISKKLQLETGFNSLFHIAKTKRNNTSAANGYDMKTESFSAGLNLENESYFFIGFRFLINKG